MDFSLDTLTDLATQYGNLVVNKVKRFQFGKKAQLAFLEDLSLLINDGIPANRAVEMMAHVGKGLNKEVASSIAHKISQGQALAEGMKEWFSPNVVEIVRVGEAGGALAQTLKSAINMLSQQGVAMGAFVGAVSYPLLVIFMACIIIIYLDGSVFEQFKAIKPVDQWPDAGHRLLFIAGLIKNWWWSAIVGVIVFTIVMRRIMTTYTGEFREQLDRFPPFSFYRTLTAARVLETLGLLVSNGVVFRAAIKVMQFQANPYTHFHLKMMEHYLSMGKTNIGDVLATGLVTDDDIMRLRIMAEVKGFEHGLIRMGVRGTEQATQTLKVIARILGGILLTIGAGLIIVIVQGIYLTGMAMGQQ